MAKGYTSGQSGQDVQLLGTGSMYRFSTLCEVCIYTLAPLAHWSILASPVTLIADYSKILRACSPASVIHVVVEGAESNVTYLGFLHSER
jgi:hypothetical protein